MEYYIFPVTIFPFFLKQFQLLSCRVFCFFFFALIEFHLSKLLIGNTQYSHLTEFGKHVFYPLYMYIGVFATWTMAQINRKLKHGKTVVDQFLAEIGVCLLLLFGFGWQIEKYQYPHNSIFTKTFQIK